MTVIIIFAVVFALAWAGTGQVRRYALSQTVLDHPNERSLHSIATPRGGGLAITVPVLVMILVLGFFNRLPVPVVWALAGGGMLVGTVGWLDDRYGIPILYRALSYLVAALWACYWLVQDSGLAHSTLIVVGVVGTFAIAWLTNLYNFMDGSDGLAAAEGFCTAGTAALLLTSASSDLSLLLWTIAAAAGGFLVWNWPPARIFMGDTGSCFLGFMLGAIAVYTSVQELISPAAWLILLSVFVCDATLTLIKRALGGQKWYQAHRQHAYQRFVLKTGSHRPLLYAVLAFNLLVLPPLALIASPGGIFAWYCVAGLYALLGGVWLIVQLKYPDRENI